MDGAARGDEGRRNGDGAEEQGWMEADARIGPDQSFLIKYNCGGQVDGASIWFDFLSKRDPSG